MSERYDGRAAAHYAAYRPPLHAMILERALGTEAPFDTGLDIGCGTGYSTLALTRYCRHVVGIDPSTSMLDRAVPHERVTYLDGSGDAIPLPEASTDLITFAGSLVYTDTDATRAEIQRVSRADALVVIYDFEIRLSDALRSFGLDALNEASDYDHARNLSGHDGFLERSVTTETLDLAMAPDQLAHVILSDSTRLDQLEGQFSESNLFAMLVQRLGPGPHPVPADLYHATYRLTSE